MIGSFRDHHFESLAFTLLLEPQMGLPELSSWSSSFDVSIIEKELKHN